MLGRIVEVAAPRALYREDVTGAQLPATSTSTMAVCAVQVEVALVYHSPCQRARPLRRVAVESQTLRRTNTTQLQACRKADPSLELCPLYTVLLQAFSAQVAQETDTIL
jgi:hypothetical protein